jgi:hypothetical protein
MSALKISVITGMALVLSLSPGPLVGRTDAAEASAVNLALKDTIIKTEDSSFPLPSGAFPVPPGNAFSQSTINCPRGQKPCTVRVEVSSQFGDLTAGDVVAIGVSIDGSQSGVKPSPTVSVHDTTSTGFLVGVRTFSWMKTGLAGGSHTIDVTFFATPSIGAFANAGFRTLTIQVYQTRIGEEEDGDRDR